MPRLKKKVSRDFTVIHNRMVRDMQLGATERGVLVTMLSMPDNWNFSIKGLTKVLPDGYTKISTALQKLEKCGYLLRKRIYESGKIVDWEYIFSDEPMHQKTDKSENDEDTLVLLESENPILVKEDGVPVLGSDLESENLILGNQVVEILVVENPSDNKINKNQILSDQVSINQSSSETETAVETVEKSDDGLMDRKAELPNGFVETLNAIGYTAESFIDDEDAAESMQIMPLDTDRLKACRIPYSFSSSKPVVELTLRIIACYDYYRATEVFPDPLLGIIAALASMATTVTAQYNKQSVTAQQVIDKINERIAAEGCLMDWLLSFLEQWERILSERRDSIKHLSAYMKSCLWKWLEDSDAETLGDVIIL